MLAEAFMWTVLAVNPGLDRPTGGVFTAVTERYGSLVVKAGRYSAESSIKPWSSWWFPLSEDYLFQTRDGQSSPLERYDAFVKKATGRNPDAALYERTNIFQPHAVAWAGLCDAWATASIMEQEPQRPRRVRGIDFRVGDLKALLLKTYEGAEGLQKYGQRFDGKWDSVYEDIYPDQFHRFLQAELYEKKLPFLMDHDAGIEVWNVPVWKAQTMLTEESDHIMHVKTWLFTASPHVKTPEYVGTEQLIREYTYDLYGDKQPDGRFTVKYGIWTGRSRWDHPDFVVPRPNQVQRRSLNQRIDPRYVDDILRGG